MNTQDPDLCLSIALYTYNQIEGAKDGWNERNDRRAFVIQGSQAWAAGQAPGEYTEGPGEVDRRIGLRLDTINKLWAESAGVIGSAKHVFIYLGSSASKRAIELASQLAPERMSFVLCDCAFHMKDGLIVQAGLSSAAQIMCECGGRRTMAKILETYLETGVIVGGDG